MLCSCLKPWRLGSPVGSHQGKQQRYNRVVDVDQEGLFEPKLLLERYFPDQTLYIAIGQRK